jgi:hypothetical protein
VTLTELPSTEQGTTQQLSKFWMPLKEFTEKAVAGLQQGDVHVPVGTAADGYKNFNEKGKLEQVKQIHERMKAHRS